VTPLSARGPAGVTPVSAVEVIKAKRDGRELTGVQIRWFLDSYTAGRIAEEQAAALLMAIVWRGMTAHELATWTAAMIASGSRLDLSGVGRPTVDKHSTGGVGDKVSLPLVAMVAACGAAVPQLSGRGLGHTGGTLDKMESIPGWQAALPPAQMVAVLQRVGAVIAAAGAGLAPADAKLYALRDVTGTVESIPLIASSIMSKKIAEGTEALVLDVKVGGGAFMADLGQGRQLAEAMVELGQAHGVATSALITAMDTPLGRAVGNAIEVEESLDVLQGRGPDDLVAVTVALAQEMLALAGIDADPDAVRHDGSALATWRAMVAAQGGDPDAALPRAAGHRVVPAPRAGYLTRLDARAVGTAVWRLGAGRARKEDTVSPTAGIWCRAKPGEWVEPGQPVLELAIDDPARVAAALHALHDAFDIGPEPPPERPLILDRIRP
jgi:thymidine phosphorylase